MKHLKTIILSICILFATAVKSQIDPASFKVSAEKEKTYLPYLMYKKGTVQDFEAWKKENKILYRKEIWYYSESFYIRRGTSPTGATIDESLIDISRFESNRQENEETVINIPGFKDAIVLLPNNKLIYKPE
jgi:hypothetical protein